MKTAAAREGPKEDKESGGPREELGFEALRVVGSLRPVRYRFNQSLGVSLGRRFPTGQEVGLIAQEVEAVLPEIVTTDKDGFK